MSRRSLNVEMANNSTSELTLPNFPEPTVLTFRTTLKGNLNGVPSTSAARELSTNHAAYPMENFPYIVYRTGLVQKPLENFCLPDTRTHVAKNAVSTTRSPVEITAIPEITCLLPAHVRRSKSTVKLTSIVTSSTRLLSSMDQCRHYRQQPPFLPYTNFGLHIKIE